MIPYDMIPYHGGDICECGHARIVHEGPLSKGCPGACGVKIALHLGRREDCTCAAFKLAEHPNPR